jgi:transcriptional regulator with XRE-family HTH domain
MTSRRTEAPKGMLTTKGQILDVFSARLRDARHRQQMTQVALAEAAGLHAIYVARLERGQQNPTLDVLVRLALALQVPVAALVPLTQPLTRRSSVSPTRSRRARR